MPLPKRLLITALLLTCCAGLLAESKKKPVVLKVRPIDSAKAATVSYTRDIKPILVNNCIECHSPEDRKSNFDASTVATLQQKGKKAGPGVVPGKPDESAIVEYIRGTREPQMPKGSPPLSEEELHLIRLWIAAGAKDDTAEIAKQNKSSEAANVNVATLDADSQKLLNELLLDELTPEQKFALRRQFRASLLPKAPEPPAVDLPTFNAIDQFIAARWKEAKLPQAKKAPQLCPDNIFIRRVYLDLIGLIPQAEKVRAFVAEASPDKRSKLIDELLARSEDYAAHWTPFWEEALCSSSTELNGGIGTRGNHHDWIYESFKQNKPYDLFVAELIDPRLPGYRAPKFFEPNGNRVMSGYIKNMTHEETITSAANVGQVFLGTGMKCASCHSHFLNKEWPQARFLGFAGMFAAKDLELIRCEKKSGQIIPAKFPFDLPQASDETPQDANARLHKVAQLVIDPTNPRFSKTIVNRLWKRYIGLGLFEPVDDFRLDQPASHPDLLEWLSQDFVRNGCDLKHTIRLILNSRTYQRAYDPALEDKFDVQKPTEPRYFRSPALRRLTAEQLIDSIRSSTSKSWTGKERTYLDKSSSPLLRALGRPAARNEVSTGRPDDVAVVQSLELLNGTEFYQFIYSSDLLAKLAASEPETAVEEIYWTALSRAPSRKEKDLAVKFLKSQLEASAGQPAVEPLGDMLWALFVSPEFQYVR